MSASMLELGRQIRRAMNSDVAVCILGESGTGKELVARALHEGGPRRRGPFVAINCAAIPDSLQESELFGHERGAFTGAVQLRRGCFEQAHGGTLFLDELGEMSASVQARLLRVLQERTIRRVGGSAEIPFDTRIVCATRRDLRAGVAEGWFREDLYYRVMVHCLETPPLRDRTGDVPLLVEQALRRFRRGAGGEPPGISADALEALERYPWPGNVRELFNVVQSSLLGAEGRELALADLPRHVRTLVPPAIHRAPRGTCPPRAPRPAGAPPAEPLTAEMTSLSMLEQHAVEYAMKRTDGNVSKAAKLLGVSRGALYRLLKKVGLPPSRSS